MVRVLIFLLPHSFKFEGPSLDPLLLGFWLPSSSSYPLPPPLLPLYPLLPVGQTFPVFPRDHSFSPGVSTGRASVWVSLSHTWHSSWLGSPSKVMGFISAGPILGPALLEPWAGARQPATRDTYAADLLTMSHRIVGGGLTQ